MSGRRAPWLVGLLAAASVALALVGVPASPAAAAVDTPTIDLLDDTNTPLPGSPFVGQEFVAQSEQDYPVGSPQSTQWRCAVDFGDGTAPSGYFRAKFPPAPCAQFHSYAAAGTYTITMTVTDPTGASAQSSTIVDVTDRDVTQVDGGKEGSAVTLTAPAGSSSYRWTVADTTHCVLAAHDARSTVLTCNDQGTYTVDVTGDSNATSGEYAVSYVNGAPDPAMAPVRYRSNDRTQVGKDVPSPRVGTGDSVQWRVDGRDPSWALAALDSTRFGDDLQCTFDFGDGTTGTDGDRTFDGCIGFHVYTQPGRYRTTVTVGDGDGGVATTTATVKVVARDVHVRAWGRQPDGLRGVVRASLTSTGIDGRMRLTTPQGRHVVVDHIDTLAADFAEVSLQGLATVDGEPGYFVQGLVTRHGRAVLLLSLTRGDPTQPWQTWTNIENVEGDRPGFQRIVRAPIVH